MWFKSRDNLSWRRSTLHERLLLEISNCYRISSLSVQHPTMKLLVSQWSTVLVALNARISCCLEDEAQPSVVHEVSFTLEKLII